MKILLATTNPHKRDEIKAILGEAVEVITLDEIELDAPEPVEDGETFQANALLKAAYYGDAAAMPTLADDSGLAVEALNGEPGVYSARYAAAEHRVRLEVSLDRAERDRINNPSSCGPSRACWSDEERSARFNCAMAMVIPPNAPERVRPPAGELARRRPLSAGMN